MSEGNSTVVIYGVDELSLTFHQNGHVLEKLR
jgi:hypothetical protein